MEYYEKFVGINSYIPVFFICLIYIYITQKEQRVVLVYPNVILLLIFFNPILGDIIQKVFLTGGVYWRVLWTIPITLIMAFSFTKMCGQLKNRIDKLCVVGLVLLMLLLSGKYIFTSENFQLSENYFKISDDVLEIAQMIDMQSIEGETPVMLAPIEIATTMRQYDPSIRMLLGRIYSQSKTESATGLYEQVNSDTPDYVALGLMAKLNGANYILLKRTAILPLPEEQFGYEWVGETDEYILYYCDNKVDPSATYQIIQFPSPDVSMFYAIVGPSNKVVLIDGGLESNSAYVRKVINMLGGRVDTWILTHPHPDHMGAFNSIYENPEGITIDNILTIGLKYEEYEQKAKSWDGIEVYQKFLALVEGKENVHMINKGYRQELLGMEMTVLNAYDSVIGSTTGDVANDGSMMFKLQGKEESILFCADVGVGRSLPILMQYGTLLKSDYLQMGHHGNGGLNEAFYRKVNPKAAFFDAPEWLMNNIDPATGQPGKWTTPKNKEIIESSGGAIYEFKTGPNIVSFN